jgi:hypothetical protein
LLRLKKQEKNVNGKPEWWSKVGFHKTGRHFSEVAALFEKMKNDDT